MGIRTSANKSIHDVARTSIEGSLCVDDTFGKCFHFSAYTHVLGAQMYENNTTSSCTLRTNKSVLENEIHIQLCDNVFSNTRNNDTVYKYVVEKFTFFENVIKKSVSLSDSNSQRK